MKMTVALRHLLITAACAWELKSVTRETRTQIPTSCLRQVLLFSLKNTKYIRIPSQEYGAQGFCNMNFGISER